jgi:hypothetical protein
MKMICHMYEHLCTLVRKFVPRGETCQESPPLQFSPSEMHELLETASSLSGMGFAAAPLRLSMKVDENNSHRS